MGAGTAIEWAHSGRRIGAQKAAARKTGCSLDEWRARRERVGKKTAGRTWDGRTWDGVPR